MPFLEITVFTIKGSFKGNKEELKEQTYTTDEVLLLSTDEKTTYYYPPIP